MGNHTTVTVAGAQGQLELNAFKPVIAYNVLQSIRLISDVAKSFTDNCIVGIEPNINRISELLEKSLMLVTALVPLVGYDNAAKIAQKALKKKRSLREEAISSGLVTIEEFDKYVCLEEMAFPK